MFLVVTKLVMSWQITSKEHLAALPINKRFTAKIINIITFDWG